MKVVGFRGLLLSIIRLSPTSLRGRWRLTRWLLGSAVLDQRDCVVETRSGQRYLVPSLREPIAFALLVDGDYEPETWDAIRQHLPVGGTFVDLGANVGLFSVKAAKHVGANGRVVAIEASPTIYPYLQVNLEASQYGNYTALQLAVTRENDIEVSFYEAPSEKFGMGSLAPQFNSRAIAVRGRTLDSILEELDVARIDVIKIDVEGYEADVFLGATRLLSSRHKPTIVFEFLDWAEQRSGSAVGYAQSILRDHGYALKVIGDVANPGETLQTPLTVGGAMLVAIPSSRI